MVEAFDHAYPCTVSVPFEPRLIHRPIWHPLKFHCFFVVVVVLLSLLHSLPACSRRSDGGVRHEGREREKIRKKRGTPPLVVLGSLIEGNAYLFQRTVTLFWLNRI